MSGPEARRANKLERCAKKIEAAVEAIYDSIDALPSPPPNSRDWRGDWTRQLGEYAGYLRGQADVMRRKAEGR